MTENNNKRKMKYDMVEKLWGEDVCEKLRGEDVCMRRKFSNKRSEFTMILSITLDSRISWTLSSA